jgi:hypothetical protein
MNTKLILLVATLSFSNLVWSQTAQKISKKSMDAIEVGAMEMISTIHIRDAKGNDRVRQITTASKTFGNVTKMLIKFISPADVKGTAILVYDYENQDDNMWIYMPALRKVRRIVSSEKGKNFMGSEFTNADMSKPNMSDFEYTTLGSETYEGKNCWKIESKCKTQAIQNANGFSKRISYIDKTNYVCYKIEYYDFTGKLHRIQSIGNYKKQSNGTFFTYKMEMENVQTKRKSEMIIDKFQIGSQLPESAFAPTALE